MNCSVIELLVPTGHKWLGATIGEQKVWKTKIKIRYWVGFQVIDCILEWNN